MTDNLDFEITGYASNDDGVLVPTTSRFRAAISDDYPYTRSTAEFRKEQFDASQNVGDQSLTGWWTRGQLSFHKGAGVKYYEVLEGETVLNRFYYSDSVNPWTPGSLTLNPALDSVACADVRDIQRVEEPDAMVTSGSLAGDQLLILKTDGSLHVAAAGHAADWSTLSITPLPLSTASLNFVHAVTGSAFMGFVAVDGRIESYKAGDAGTTLLWTHSTGWFYHLYYMKGRLWAADYDGNWYVLAATSGGAVGVVDKDFAIPGTNDRYIAESHDLFSAVETPGPVLIGAHNRIWAVELDESSGTPVLSAPRAVAVLPNNEYISSMAYESGTLVIATNRGVRLGLLSGSEIVYGPLVDEDIDHSRCQRIVASGSQVLVGGSDQHGQAGLYAYNISQEVSDLVPAYTLMYSLPAGSWMGAYPTDRGLVMWSNDSTDLHRTSQTNLAEAGSLLTGYHRFGTLEGKHFHTVSVRATGPGGTLTVYRVKADGTEAPLQPPGNTPGDYEINVSGITGTPIELPLQVDSPEERIALRFELKRSPAQPGDGPEFLGYQLKALPSPVRQRLIRWPVLVADVYQDRHGVSRGTSGAAWKAWRSLEALEQSDALVTYTDHRTQETGTAYIEATELRTDTPSSRGATSSFGGIGYVVLRRV